MSNALLFAFYGLEWQQLVSQFIVNWMSTEKALKVSWKVYLTKIPFFGQLLDFCKGTPQSLSFPSYDSCPFHPLQSPFWSSKVLSGTPKTFRNHPEFLNSTLPPLDQPHFTSRHTTVQSTLMLFLCTCFPAFLARFPQSILFRSSLARSVVYYSICIIFSYIFSLDLPLLAWVISLRTARLPLQ